VLGQSGGLTAEDAGRRAAETSVQAAIEREKVVSARNDRARVIWNALPKLTLSGQVTRLSEVEPFALPPELTIGLAPADLFPLPPRTAYSLNANLSVPFTEYILRMVTALRGAGENEAAASLTEQATRAGVAASAKLAYYDWVRARLQRVLAEQALEQARAQQQRVQALRSAGRAAEVDVQQALAFNAEAELTLSRADTLQALAEQRLRTVVHAPPEEGLAVGENVLAPFPGSEEPRPLTELYREAEQQRLELKALDKGHAALDRLLTVEKTRALPRLEGFGNFTYANPNQRVFPQQDQWDESWELGLSLTWSTGELGNSVTAAEAARSQRDQVAHQRTLALENLRLEVASAYRALAQARVNVVTAEQGERAAATALEARARLEEQGMATALELMQAQTAQVQARLNLIDAHIALRVARVQLDHALGRDVVGRDVVGRNAAGRDVAGRG
jgi:outer membrane protein TolC